MVKKGERTTLIPNKMKSGKARMARAQKRKGMEKKNTKLWFELSKSSG